MSTFEEIAKELGELVTEKNEAYGDSAAVTGAILAFLYPDGAQADQYDDLLLTVRVLDKLSRIAHRKGVDGDKESPWFDIAGYGLLGERKDRFHREELNQLPLFEMVSTNVVLIECKDCGKEFPQSKKLPSLTTCWECRTNPGKLPAEVPKYKWVCSMCAAVFTEDGPQPDGFQCTVCRALVTCVKCKEPFMRETNTTSKLCFDCRRDALNGA